MNEEWRDVPGFEGNYKVSNLGQVMSIPRPNTRGGVLKTNLHRQGYLMVTLYKSAKRKTMLVHRLVAIAFIGDIPQGKEVNHINGDKGDNRLENLEYVTPSENQLHACHVLRTARVHGENHHKAKVNDDKVRQMRREYASGAKPVHIAKRYDLSLTTTYQILHRELWKHIA